MRLAGRRGSVRWAGEVDDVAQGGVLRPSKAGDGIKADGIDIEATAFLGDEGVVDVDSTGLPRCRTEPMRWGAG